MSPTSGSTTWTRARAVSLRRTTASPTCKRDLATALGRVFCQCRLCGSFLDPQVEHGELCRTIEATLEHYACVHAVFGGVRLADPGITTEPRGLTEAPSRTVDLFTAAAVPGRSAGLDVCVWPPKTQQQLEETLRKQPLIVNYHGPDNKYLIFVVRASFTAPWCRHPNTAARTDFASSRNGQQMSATSLQHRWTHEIQKSAPSAKGSHDLPNPSARAEWLLAGLIDRALSHWVRAPPLDGRDDDGDADAGTDTATPDDDANEDIASHQSTTTSLQQSNFWSCLLAPLGLLAL